MNSAPRNHPSTQAAHTPVPWRVGVPGRIEVERRVIADVLGYNGKEGSANAAFIVRACNSHAELLEALEQIALGEGRMSRDPLTHCQNAVEDMKALAVAAIAKAKL